MNVMSVLNLRLRKLGSLEEYTISLSRSLTQQGGQSTLVFKDFPPTAFRSQYTEAGAILDVKPFAPFSWESAVALLALARRYKPDVVHFHFVNLLSLDVLVACMSRVQVVFSEHASDVAKKRSPIRWQLLRLCKRSFSSMVDQVIAPSHYVNARLVREGVSARRVTTIHNGVNFAKFKDASVGEYPHQARDRTR